jgi:hypothetical protein
MQTSVNINMNPFFAGQIIDTRNHVIESHPADVEIAFGLGVVAGAGADSVKLPTADTEVFRGITVHNHREQPYPTAAGTSYAAKAMVPTGRVGVFGIVTSKAVTKDTAAYLNVTTGTFTDSNSGTIATGGKFRTTVAAAGLSTIEINLP